MDYKDAIICVQAKRYSEAANYMLKEMLEKKIHDLTSQQREKLTARVAEMLKKNHQQTLELDRGNYPSYEIARQAYEDTASEIEFNSNTGTT